MTRAAVTPHGEARRSGIEPDSQPDLESSSVTQTSTQEVPLRGFEPLPTIFAESCPGPRNSGVGDVNRWPESHRHSLVPITVARRPEPGRGGCTKPYAGCPAVRRHLFAERIGVEPGPGGHPVLETGVAPTAHLTFQKFRRSGGSRTPRSFALNDRTMRPVGAVIIASPEALRRQRTIAPADIGGIRGGSCTRVVRLETPRSWLLDDTDREKVGREAQAVGEPLRSMEASFHPALPGPMSIRGGTCTRVAGSRDRRTSCCSTRTETRTRDGIEVALARLREQKSAAPREGGTQ